MPSRIFPFVNGEYYHIYNRGVEKKPIFNIRRDYTRFLKTINYYQFAGPKPKLSRFLFNPDLIVKPNLNDKIVEIVCYCLMPNHFHFLVKQLKDGGITEFVSKLSNSYTKYFNTKHTRVGPLFQGEFKAVLVTSDEQLIHVSRYIHLNPAVAYLVKNLDQYEWSSYSEYIHGRTGLSVKKDILAFFKSSEEYKKFILDHYSYALDLASIKHQLLDGEE